MDMAEVMFSGQETDRMLVGQAGEQRAECDASGGPVDELTPCQARRLRSAFHFVFPVHELFPRQRVLPTRAQRRTCHVERVA